MVSTCSIVTLSPVPIFINVTHLIVFQTDEFVMGMWTVYMVMMKIVGSLVKLDFRRNNLGLNFYVSQNESFYPFSQQKSLEYLDLSFCQINLMFSNCFKGLISLKCLGLQHNNISTLKLRPFIHLSNLTFQILLKDDFPANNMTFLKRF